MSVKLVTLKSFIQEQPELRSSRLVKQQFNRLAKRVGSRGFITDEQVYQVLQGGSGSEGRFQSWVNSFGMKFSVYKKK